MLVVQDANQLGSTLNHHAGALDRGSKRLVNVRRGALQADGVGLNEGIILQSIVVEHFNVGVLCAVWRTLAKKYKNYLTSEARGLMAV